MFHPTITKMLAEERIESLKHDANAHFPRRDRVPAADVQDVEVRLCRVSDDPQLEELSQLSERPLPFGRLVVGVVNGRIVAAVPVSGGYTLRDPFAKTSHVVPLLELRAAQLREAGRRRFGLWRYASLIRRSTHA